MKKIIFLTLLVNTFITKIMAQEAMAITDSFPALFQGLKAGYTILDASEKEVNDKGNFSRFKIHFFVTNISPSAKFILQKPGFGLNIGGVSPNAVQFKCLNATGYRLTNKETTLQFSTCKIEANVEDKVCGTDKTVINRRFVDIGYWIKPGETIAANSIMIVPLGEKPNMTVTYLPNSNTIIATPLNNEYQPAVAIQQNFARIKSFATNNYLNNQNGPLACTTINDDWWSSQWEIIPVNGTNNVLIRNRWKNNYISTENPTLISDNGQTTSAMWQIEKTNLNTVFYIKNVSNNAKLSFQNGVLKVTNSANTSFIDASEEWIIEK